MQDIVSLGIAVSACEKGAQWQLALHFLQKNRIMQRARDIELRFPQENWGPTKKGDVYILPAGCGLSETSCTFR